MDAYALVRTPQPRQFVTAVADAPGVRTARLLVGNHDAFVAMVGDDPAELAAIRETLYVNGARETSLLVAAPPPLPVPVDISGPWYTPDAPTCLVVGVRVQAGAAAAVFAALANRIEVAGAVVTIGEFDLVLKISLTTPAEVGGALTGIGGVQGVVWTESAYVLPA